MPKRLSFLLKFIPWLTAVPLLIGCAGGGDDPQYAPLTANQLPSGSSEKPLSHEVAEEDAPGFYSIKLTLKSKVAHGFRLYRVVERNGQNEMQLVLHSLKSQDEITLPHEKSGESFQFKLTQSGANDQEEDVETDQFTLPKDLIISSPVDLKDVDLTNLNRLYLLDKAVLTTFGTPLKLNVNKLIVEKGAMIESFPAGSMAADNQAGSSGGQIEITAAHASGALEVVMRGQNAGRWATEPQGRQGDESARGPNGSPGSPGYSDCYERPHNMGTQCMCAGGSKAGSPGGPGQPGLGGFMGLAGGDTGNLVVNIANGSNFTILHHREAGLGGPGSQGGRGGPGGYGGPPVNNEDRCSSSAGGPPGAEGPRGPSGGVGPNGQTGQVCLKLSENVGTTCL